MVAILSQPQCVQVSPQEQIPENYKYFVEQTLWMVIEFSCNYVPKGNAINLTHWPLGDPNKILDNQFQN